MALTNADMLQWNSNLSEKEIQPFSVASPEHPPQPVPVECYKLPQTKVRTLTVPLYNLEHFSKLVQSQAVCVCQERLFGGIWQKWTVKTQRKGRNWSLRELGSEKNALQKYLSTHLPICSSIKQVFIKNWLNSILYKIQDIQIKNSPIEDLDQCVQSNKVMNWVWIPRTCKKPSMLAHLEILWFYSNIGPRDKRISGSVWAS